MRMSYCRRLMVAVLLVLSPVLSLAQDSPKPNFHPTLNVNRISGKIDVNGDLTDAAWAMASRTESFVETDPGDQIPTDVRSAVMIGYDDANLYIALIAWDNPQSVRTSYSERDNIWRDDYFGVMLDTYGDKSGGYEIFCNPYGVQGDIRITNSSGNEDDSYNMIFYSAGKVTDSGYQIEMAIPFSSLRFAAKDEQIWGAQFWRDRQREARYRYAWAPVNRNDPCWICGWGTLTGIKGIEPANNIEVLPSVVGLQSGVLNVNNTEPTFDFSNANPDAELSATVRYSPTSSSTAEVAVNPDFSQVESDAGQIDVNTTFALFFSERRPFFQEGSELYQTPITAVYTRSINDPIVAGKFTGRFGATKIAYSIARDDHSGFLIPLFSRSRSMVAGKSTVNMFRAQTALGKGSTIGLVATDRRMDQSGSGSLLGVDGSLRFLKNWQLSFQTLYSHTAEPNDPSLTESLGLTRRIINGADTTYDTTKFDRNRHTAIFDGESFFGYGSSVSLNRDARTLDWEISYQSYHPNFRADNGFVYKNDYQQWNFWSGLNFRRAKGLLLRIQPSMSVGGILKADQAPFNWSLDELQDSWINPHLYIEAKHMTSINLDYTYSREVFRGKEFPGISRINLNCETRIHSKLGIGMFIGYGHVIARNLGEPQLGVARNHEFWATWRPTKHLMVQPNFSYSRMDYRKSYLDQHPGTDKEIFAGYIFRTRTTYQFNREWNLRLVVQYDDFGKQLDVEPLLTWQANPFTIFYVGANSSVRKYTPDDYNYLDASHWRESQRQFFAKLQYLFRV